MIRTFKCKETNKIFCREFSRKFPKEIHHIALRKLAILDAAMNLNDLRVPPGNRLERLSGNLKGRYSIRINDQWRICFKWEDGDSYSVEICDYH